MVFRVDESTSPSHCHSNEHERITVKANIARCPLGSSRSDAKRLANTRLVTSGFFCRWVKYINRAGV